MDKGGLHKIVNKIKNLYKLIDLKKIKKPVSFTYRLSIIL